MAGPKTKKGSDGLSDLDRRFCLEYLVDLNALDAYIRASLPRKVTRKTAGTNGWKLLQRPEIQKRVRAARDEALAKADLSVQDTMTTLRRLLMYDVRKIFSKDGHPIKVTDLDDDTAAAVVGIKVVTKGNAEMGFGQVMELKLADKNSALEKAMRFHALFEKDNRQKTDPVTDLIKSIYGVGGRLKVSE